MKYLMIAALAAATLAAGITMTPTTPVAGVASVAEVANVRNVRGDGTPKRGASYDYPLVNMAARYNGEPRQNGMSYDNPLVNTASRNDGMPNWRGSYDYPLVNMAARHNGDPIITRTPAPAMVMSDDMPASIFGEDM